MQRKQLEKHYNVTIYQVSGGYILVENGEEKRFKYMADIEDYLEEKYEKR